MKTLQVHISQLNPACPPYVSAQVHVPGLGDIEMKDVVSQATIDNLFAEVAAAADLKLRGKIGATKPVATDQGGGE